MGKTSIFTAYSVLCLIGFAGVSALSFAGKINEPTTVAAFFAFYGFLCTTGLFWVVGRLKAQMEWYDERHHDNNSSVAERFAEVYRSVESESQQMNRRIDETAQDMQREVNAVWNAIESAPSKK